MTPDRLRQIEQLYHCVRQVPADERIAVLAQADPELRREVESLLAGQNDRMILDASTRLTVGPGMAQPQPGALLGPYRVESKIGEGGMEEVFRALDTRLGRPVAIKFAHREFTARFEREARAISSLNHPNICTLYDIGPNYLVMELVEGETLAARLKNGPLPVEQALLYAGQIADSLAVAHKQGVVHRDLKPGNIMLTRNGAKVLDFGLATVEGDETLTGSRMVLGTPGYMAPEQRAGKPADARSDLYSLGCVIYEMLTGARATPDRKPTSSASLEKVVSRCLETDPSRRWQSAAELEDAIKAAPNAASSRVWLVPAAAILVALLIGGYFLFRRSPVLTEKDTIVLADFVNHTTDAVFDGTLRQGLAIQLEQSPFLKIMDDGQVQRVIRRMSLGADAHLTNQTAHEVCLREGAAATIDGAIASLGNSFVVTLQAVSCRDGATLAREQIQAADREHVLSAVGTAATAMRGKLGESFSSIQRRNRPLEQVTTPSLEALQSYSAGLSTMTQGRFVSSVPLFERAIALDPNFAMAYMYLGVEFEQAGDMPRSAEYAKKAFRFADRVSENERFTLTAYNYRATGELDKEIDAWQRAVGDPRRQWSSHNQLGLVYIDMGQYEEGLKEGLQGVELQADVEPLWRRVLDADICLDRLPEAKEVAEKVRARHLDGPRIHQRFLEMAYVEDDPAAISKEIQWFAGKPEEYLSLGLQAASRNVHGQRRESHNLYQRAAETAQRRGLQSASSEFEEGDALAGALSGNCQTARRIGHPALALAICGDETGAEKLAAETSKLFPNGTIWNAVQLPAIRAAVALNHDQPARSLELLASASPYERSYLDSVYLRGLAYLRLYKGPEAVAEFRKIVDHKGANWGATWIHPWWGQFYSLSYLGVARGFALAGDTVKARKWFEDFFELWKDADPDIPILKQAKAEYVSAAQK